MVDVCDYLIYGQFITLGLFILSEIIGYSKCEYNGVFDLIIGGCQCLGDREYRVRFTRNGE
jgi:hypothetical protein